MINIHAYEGTLPTIFDTQPAGVVDVIRQLHPPEPGVCPVCDEPAEVIAHITVPGIAKAWAYSCLGPCDEEGRE